MSDMTPQELLLKAAEYMSERGHNKGTYFNECGNVCAYGAMTLAVTEGAQADYAFSLNISSKFLVDQAAVLLAQTVDPNSLYPNDMINYAFDTITKYNDARNTTGEDVIRKMRQAANA